MVLVESSASIAFYQVAAPPPIGIIALVTKFAGHTVLPEHAGKSGRAVYSHVEHYRETLLSANRRHPQS
jgi:hypothetical protein